MTSLSSPVIGMVLFPNFTHLDLTGPFEVFGRIPKARVVAAVRRQGAQYLDARTVTAARAAARLPR